MTSADEIRAGLVKAAQERADADKQHAHATRDLAVWLRKAQASPELSMSEAAKLAGVARKNAYALIRRK